MKHLVVLFLWTICICSGVISTAIQLPQELSDVVNDYKQLDNLMTRVDASNSTFHTKELCKFALSTAEKELSDKRSLENTLNAFGNAIEEGIVTFLLVAQTENKNILKVLKEQRKFHSINGNLQNQLHKNESHIFHPIKWMLISSVRPMLQGYMSYLHRALLETQNLCLTSCNDAEFQLNKLFEITKRARVLLMAAETVLSSVDHSSLVTVLHNPPVITDDAVSEDEQPILAERFVNKLIRCKQRVIKLAMGTSQFLMSLIGAGIIMPLMCAMPGIMMAQCLWIVVSFTSLQLIIIAAYIAFLRQEYFPPC